MTLDTHQVVTVALGATHSIALCADGTMWSWGGGEIQSSTDCSTEQVSGDGAGGGGGGKKHRLRKRLSTIGSHKEIPIVTKLGLGDGVPHTKPRMIPHLSGGRVTAIAAGYAHSMCITEDGGLWTWGESTHGALGHGDTGACDTPKRVMGLSQYNVTHITCNRHSMAVTDDGRLWCWGTNMNGRLGIGNYTAQHSPVVVTSGLQTQKVVSMAAGFNHVLAVTQGGTLWMWGHRFHGESGHGMFEDQTQPVAVGGIHSVVDVVAGDNHTIAICQPHFETG
eukprot:NODE_61_length_1852_cov_363.278841_g60_i0.p1 GENE.NODE_61_length_1852_cov_363.278841_g60_i0~~NODE_61_length_1852_cov_363.278841_g60_i0.p1  ORF type:complete len:279 (+),score=84.90 NODE_61_length_1852_cov_363.278841_g60_i0:851-1687(+)